jgi:hypothetical protein
MLRGGKIDKNSTIMYMADSPHRQTQRGKKPVDKTSPGKTQKMKEPAEKKPTRQPQTDKKPADKKKPDEKAPPKKPTGVQAHGKEWENQIISVIVSSEDLDEALNQPYTSQHDIPKELNKKSGRNVSIKATGNNRVDFGDAGRVIEALKKDDSPLEAIVVKYQQKGQQKDPQEVIRVDLSKGKDVLFGSAMTPEFEARILDLSNRLKGGENPKEDTKKLQDEMKNAGAYMILAPKVGNKVKKRAGRLQISLSNIQKLIKEHPDLVLEHQGCEVYGQQCLTVLESGRRVLGKKNKDVDELVKSLTES